MADNIVFFDGDCMLCNRSIQFIIQHDQHGKINFSALQSPIAKNLLKNHEIDLKELNTVYYLENGTLYRESDAILKIAKHLNAPYSFARILILIPNLIRDFCYRWIAKRRIKFFGKAKACWLPTKELSKRFLSQP